MPGFPAAQTLECMQLLRHILLIFSKSVASLQSSAFTLPAEMLLTVPPFHFIRLIKLGFLVLGAPGGQSTPHPIHQVPDEAPKVPALVPGSLGFIKARPLARTLGLPAVRPALLLAHRHSGFI